MAHATVKSLGQPTNTLFLLENLGRDLPAARDLNRHSLYWILKADRRFRLTRRFHVSLQEWGKDASYTPVANAILKTLREAGRPLTDREIHGRLLVARTIRLYSVSQCLARLAKRGQVVKTARATYAAASSTQASLQKIDTGDCVKQIRLRSQRICPFFKAL
jgi:predicted transcriptional regulator